MKQTAKGMTKDCSLLDDIRAPEMCSKIQNVTSVQPVLLQDYWWPPTRLLTQILVALPHMTLDDSVSPLSIPGCVVGQWQSKVSKDNWVKLTSYTLQ